MRGYIKIEIFVGRFNEYFLKVIFRSGDEADSIYFIAAGTVAVYSPGGHEVCHMHDGDFFGEIGLLSSSDTRTACVVAVENCSLYRLDREDFEETISPFPDLVATLQKTANDRANKIKLMDVKSGAAHASYQPCIQSYETYYERDFP